MLSLSVPMVELFSMGREPRKAARIVGQYEVPFDFQLPLVDKISNVCAINSVPDLHNNYRRKEV